MMESEANLPDQCDRQMPHAPDRQVNLRRAFEARARTVEVRRHPMRLAEASRLGIHPPCHWGAANGGRWEKCQRWLGRL